jgi:hypothetical protein
VLFLQHYCDEVNQGVSQATADARRLHDTVARLAAQCTPHDQSPPPVIATVVPTADVTPAAAAAGANAGAVEQPIASRALNVVSYSDHSAGNIYHRSNGSTQPQFVRKQSQNGN